MSERVVVPKHGPLVATGDLTAEVSVPFNYARRFSVTVAEEALARMGPAVIAHVTERLAESIAYEQRMPVHDLVSSFLRDRAWAEPIIRKAIQDTVREYVRDMLDPPPSGKPAVVSSDISKLSAVEETT